MIEYIVPVEAPARIDNRWELYRVLAEPVRLRLLAAAARDELTIGELAELTGESQPNISRHLAPLRRLGLLTERKQGTRVLVRLAEPARRDAVVMDALASGTALCEPDAMLERIAPLIKRRDAAAREFFARPVESPQDQRHPDELAAYLMAIAPLLARRELAVDVGTGEGRLLEVLAPLFDKVIAIDREPAQLERARVRTRLRGYQNVELMIGDLLSEAVQELVQHDGLADAVFASRVLHHAPRPAEAMVRLASLARPGGAVIVLDYAPHEDEMMREEQADLWLGFSAQELAQLARAAGLSDARTQAIPQSFRGTGPDRHLVWQIFSARREIAVARK
jgi:DNA-binding transcriptional ArsR family regulator/ubiquinone/menaquinone biosynthesis C-methylase UbiE